MRSVTYSMGVSLDGYIAGPNGEFDWIVIDPDIDFGALAEETTRIDDVTSFMVESGFNVLLTFYMVRPVEFSTFPSLLLIATLFRLSLNVAATRLILSDGDAVFQPRKVERSGLWQAFENRVLIYVHKEQELDDVERHYPADHYVLIDDKLRILAAVKKIWG